MFSYSLSLNVVEYQTAVLRGDMEGAAEILPSIPKEHRNKIATFLESRGTNLAQSIGDVLNELQVSRSLHWRSRQTRTRSSSSPYN